MGRQFSRAFERVQNVSFAPVNLPRRWRANDALTYRHNPPANERPSHGPYPRWMSELRRAWWTLNTPSKFRDSSNFFGRALSLARLFRSIASPSIERAAYAPPGARYGIQILITRLCRTVGLIGSYLPSLLTHLYIYIYNVGMKLRMLLSFPDLIDLIDFFSVRAKGTMKSITSSERRDL